MINSPMYSFNWI